MSPSSFDHTRIRLRPELRQLEHVAVGRYYCASLLPQLHLVLLDVAFLAIQQLDAKAVALLANDLERDATRYGGHDFAVVIGQRTNGDAVLPAPANLHHVRDRKSTRLNSSHGYIS